jgi:hypothetical protein
MTRSVTVSLLFVLLLGLGISLAGRGGCGWPAETPDTRTPGQYFRDEQEATVTPHGRILTDSVEERDGKIEYSTQDGRRWRVGFSKRADGTYEYETPEAVKK